MHKFEQRNNILEKADGVLFSNGDPHELAGFAAGMAGSALEEVKEGLGKIRGESQ